MIKEAYDAGFDYALEKIAKSDPFKDAMKDKYKSIQKEGPGSRLGQAAGGVLKGGLTGGAIGTLVGAPFLAHPKTRRFGAHLPFQAAGLTAAAGGLVGAARDPEERHKRRLAKYKYYNEMVGNEV